MIVRLSTRTGLMMIVYLQESSSIKMRIYMKILATRFSLLVVMEVSYNATKYKPLKNYFIEMNALIESNVLRFGSPINLEISQSMTSLIQFIRVIHQDLISIWKAKVQALITKDKMNLA